MMGKMIGSRSLYQSRSLCKSFCILLCIFKVTLTSFDHAQAALTKYFKTYHGLKSTTD